MDGYQVDEVPFYTNPDKSIEGFHGLARKLNNRPIIAIRHGITRKAYLDWLPELLDEIVSIGLDLAQEETILKVREFQVDLKQAPEKYVVFYIIHIACEGQEDERKEERQETLGKRFLQTYTEKVTFKIITALLRVKKPNSSANEGTSERYQTDSEPFYMNEGVCLFKGVFNAFNGLPIVVKRHKFCRLQHLSELSNVLAKHVNAGIAQALVKHPHTCKILEMHLDSSKAPERFYVYHILEALEKDVRNEIEERKSEQRLLSEWELWKFLQQTSSALTYAHQKVRDT